MASYRAQPSRGDRAIAIVAVAGVHLAIGALVLNGRSELPAMADRVRTVLIDIAPPDPPPPPPEPQPERTREEEGAAGKKADPTPLVTPQPRVIVPATTPVSAAPVAGTGSSPDAGAASAGSGPGAGGSGSGRGGGGGGGRVRIATEARLLSGNLGRSDYRRLQQLGASSGRALLALSIGTDGRLSNCAVVGSSGDAGLDSAVCAILKQRMRWSAARDQEGRPIPVGVRWVATWDRN